jgi:transposase-like protein
MSKRCTHSPEFKAKVAMGSISGDKTIQEIAADHAIYRMMEAWRVGHTARVWRRLQRLEELT